MKESTVLEQAQALLNMQLVPSQGMDDFVAKLEAARVENDDSLLDVYIAVGTPTQFEKYFAEKISITSDSQGKAAEGSEAPLLKDADKDDRIAVKLSYTTLVEFFGKIDPSTTELPAIKAFSIYRISSDTFYGWLAKTELTEGQRYNAAWWKFSVPVAVASLLWMESCCTAQPAILAKLNAMTQLAGGMSTANAANLVNLSFAVANPLFLGVATYFMYYWIATASYRRENKTDDIPADVLKAIRSDARDLSYKVMAGMMGWTVASYVAPLVLDACGMVTTMGDAGFHLIAFQATMAVMIGLFEALFVCSVNLFNEWGKCAGNKAKQSELLAKTFFALFPAVLMAGALWYIISVLKLPGHQAVQDLLRGLMTFVGCGGLFYGVYKGAQTLIDKKFAKVGDNPAGLFKVERKEGAIKVKEVASKSMSS